MLGLWVNLVGEQNDHNKSDEQIAQNANHGVNLGIPKSGRVVKLTIIQPHDS